MLFNPALMLNTDGYKLDHRRQYPPSTEFVYSYYACRASRYPGQEAAVAFNVQGAVSQLQELADTFFATPKEVVVQQYQEFLDGYLGPNDIGTDHIAALHDLGYLPLEFHAVPEGTLVPLRMPVFTVVNTHPEFFWLTNYFETFLSAHLWQGINAATIAYRYRKIFDTYAQVQGYADPNFVQWQGHDFSYRGMGTTFEAMLAGAGHLLSFTGTDTLPAIEYLKHYYDAEGLIGGSVPATEHAVMCAGGKLDEYDTYERLLNLYPNGIVSIVSDTWDLWHVVTDIVPRLKNKIMARDGRTVIRPDSGDPVKIICGDPDAKPGSPEFKGVYELLWDIFGGTVNSKGYKVLDTHIGAIYGDSITEERADAILYNLGKKGFSGENQVFGIGSFTYHMVTRDSLSQALKAVHAVIDGEEHFLEKDPVTDSGVKKSATGRMQIFQTPTGIEMRDGLTIAQWEGATFNGSFGKEFIPLLQPVWRDGQWIRRTTLAEIRERLHPTVNVDSLV